MVKFVLEETRVAICLSKRNSLKASLQGTLQTVQKKPEEYLDF